jgi:hypothetical protein
MALRASAAAAPSLRDGGIRRDDIVAAMSYLKPH